MPLFVKFCAFLWGLRSYPTNLGFGGSFCLTVIFDCANLFQDYVLCVVKYIYKFFEEEVLHQKRIKK